MKVKFWGTRGSIPTPGKDTNKYGGNTSCVEVRAEDGTTVILDCGSGLRCLGEDMGKRNYKEPLHAHILITHFHWDHIQGIPFFAPFSKATTEWDIYAPKGVEISLEEALAGQMQSIYFPLKLSDFTSKIRYHQLVKGEFTIGSIKVKTHYLNHTALTLAYRLEVDGAVLVYSTDHEPYDPKPVEKLELMTRRDQDHVEFLRGADLVIHDAQYKADEYKTRIGWGHSPYGYVVDVCSFAKVKQVAFFHHDPSRTDDELDGIASSINEKLQKSGNPLKTFCAEEGVELDLKGVIQKEPPIEQTGIKITKVLIGSTDKKNVDLIASATDGFEIVIETFDEGKSLVESCRKEFPSLVLIDENFSDIKSIANDISILKDEQSEKVPIILLCSSRPNIDDINKLLFSDHLVKNMSESFVRSRILCWIMGRSCKWKIASIPPDENERIEFLRKNNILDSEHEERFDLLTRMAATTFNVPIALITLIDSERQWFKSVYGAKATETPREVSFCAHAVFSREPLIINDTLLDERFADNPYVKGSIRIRFYAGIPLILPNRVCIGTLCIMDTKPRFFTNQDVQLLKKMAHNVLQELTRSQTLGNL
jgi:phosphoribosyl 1,2-cyclic phosphodiesterase/CheY-like chemotaxis protein